jgi:hypothetical protein
MRLHRHVKSQLVVGAENATNDLLMEMPEEIPKYLALLLNDSSRLPGYPQDMLLQ